MPRLEQELVVARNIFRAWGFVCKVRNQAGHFQDQVDSCNSQDPEEYVLANDSGGPWFENETCYTRAFGTKLNKLGIFGKQPWHSFRHTGAIELFEITGDIYIVKTFLRHELIETTKRYLNSNRVNHVVEKNQNFLGKKTVRTLRNQEPKNKLIEINPSQLKEVA